MHYRYASGREATAPIIALANNKRSISLYFNTQAPDGGYFAESYRDRLTGADVGKGCVRFTRLDKVDATILREMVESAAASTVNPRS